MTSSARSELDNVFRKYAWDYFSVHAAQRLTGFQFFITLATAIVGGYFALISTMGELKWISILGALLTLLSFIFFKLDSRTKDLIKNAENALSYLESQQNLSDINGMPHPLRLIDRGDQLCQSGPNQNVLVRRYSYSECFRIVFFSFGLLGLLAVMHALFFLPVNGPKSKAEPSQAACTGNVVNGSVQVVDCRRIYVGGN